MGNRSGKKIAVASASVAVRIPAWRTKGGVLLAAVLLWLAIVFAYAGPMATSAAVCLILDGGVLILWLAAAIGIGGFLFRLFRTSAHPAPSGLLSCITAAALGLGCMSLLILGLGLMGFLNQVTAIGLIVLGIGALIVQFVSRRDTLQIVEQWRSEPAGMGWLKSIRSVETVTSGLRQKRVAVMKDTSSIQARAVPPNRVS